MRWNFLIIVFTLLFISKNQAQTVIEMMHPLDANLVLLEVDSPDKADIVVYKTNDKKLYQQYDCKWKFKSWGFSNFSVYITKDENDSLLLDEETGRKRPINGKVYFTNDISQAGYKNPDFRLEGVFRKIAKTEDEE
jgi:hypothetical protein